MRKIMRVVLPVLLAWAQVSDGASLTYKVRGIDDAVKKNVQAWLGKKPETERERSNFVVSAEDKVRSSLKALGYYRPDINISIDRTGSTWEMTVNVDKNQAVLIKEIDVRILGAAQSDPAFVALLEDLPIQIDDKLDHSVYDSLKKRLSALGQQRGYFDGELKRSRVEVNAQANSAKVILHYNSARRYRIGDVQLDSMLLQTSWSDAVVKIRAGDWFNWKSLQQLRNDLQQTRYYSSVIVKPLIEQRANGEVPVVVELTPVSRHSFEIGLGYSTDTQGRVSFGWKTPVINRYGHSQETRLEYSAVNPSGRFNYNIPLTHPRNDVLQLSAYLADKEYGDISALQKGVQVSREVKWDNWIASYSLRTLDESWEEGVEHLSSSYVLPGASVSHKTRSGSLVDPQSGFRQVYQLEAGSADWGSEIDMIRAYSNFRYVTRFGERQRLVARGELGAVFIDDDDRRKLAPSLSFFTGGSQSLRGFDYQSIGVDSLVVAPEGAELDIVLGGDRLAVASLEYQYYVTDTWRAAIFADAGDAFDEGEFDAHYGVGVGAHYLSPVGAIRLELASDLSEDSPSWKIHLNIGAEF